MSLINHDVEDDYDNAFWTCPRCKYAEHFTREQCGQCGFHRCLEHVAPGRRDPSLAIAVIAFVLGCMALAWIFL